MINRTGLAVIVVSAGLAGLLGVTSALPADVVVSIDEVPAPVRATILAAAQGGTIVEIERGDADGRVVYEAEITIDGRVFEIEVGPDGTLLARGAEDDDGDDNGDDESDDDDDSSDDVSNDDNNSDDNSDDDDDESDDDDDSSDEQVISMREAPVVVQAALLELAAGNDIVEVVREDAGGVAMYEASWLVDGMACEATVTDRGTLVELEQVVSESSVPDAVIRAAHEALAPSAELRFERRMIVIYQVTAEIDGARKGLLVRPSGHVIASE